MTERLDIVDMDGRPTGQIEEKSIIHSQGLWHRDVHVWLTNGRELLQQQRVWSKSIMPGQWDVSVGGHVAAGESYLAAARRETEEELGLRFAPQRFLPAGKLAVDMAMSGWRHRTAGDNFVVVEPDLKLSDLTIQDSEVAGARWYDIDQLEADIRNDDMRAGHAEQPPELWHLGILAMRLAVS
jgi:isopentenyl-diphosphate delta-isomerase